MTNIYQDALDAKFENILEVMARDQGHQDGMTGLTSTQREFIRNLAEQAIVDWACLRSSSVSRPLLVTNLQHLLNEYCAIAEHV